LLASKLLFLISVSDGPWSWGIVHLYAFTVGSSCNSDVSS